MNWAVRARAHFSKAPPTPTFKTIEIQLRFSERPLDPTIKTIETPISEVSEVPPLGVFKKHDAANEPTDPDRWCWPNSQAMNTVELESFANRTARVTNKGLSPDHAEVMADRLVQRDRASDERRLCLECRHLLGRAGFWRCGNHKSAGLGEAGLPAELVLLAQRCPGFSIEALS